MDTDVEKCEEIGTKPNIGKYVKVKEWMKKWGIIKNKKMNEINIHTLLM